MSAWQPIETAPKNKYVLLYGAQRPFDGVTFKGPFIFSGYWDELDEAWCSHGSTWDGPFYDPTHWQPLPPEPAA